tara:strand:- start:637 stop:2478 length:1842 start_codon:yes stop_codon:yes gene_type:complete
MIDYIKRNGLLIFTDIIVSVFSTYIAYSIRLETYYLPFSGNVGLDPILSLNAYLLCALLFIPIFHYAKIYEFIPKYFDLNLFIRIFYSSIVYATILFLIFSNINFGIPRSIAIIQPIIFCFLIFLLRISSISRASGKKKTEKNVVIYGAGTAGFQLLNSINESREFNVKLFIDDDQNKVGKIISGIKIISLDDAEKDIKKFNISSIIVAIPSLNLNSKRELISRCERFNINIKTLPTLSDIINEKITIKDVKNLNINDLIGRDIKIKDLDKSEFKDKEILITGAGGSIGSELCKQLVFQSPSKLILLDHSEYNLYAIKEKLEKIIELNNLNTNLIYSLTSINNYGLLKKLLLQFNLDFIFHAAAYKHVELVEKNIFESLNNNFFGSLNLVSLCDELEFKNLMLISSDKAVRPTSIMGASKRLSELIVQAYATKKETKTTYSIVRFGNVLGSSGSVINKFNEQIEQENYVTVTHPEVTRFFMTVQESVNLIIHASLMAKGGEIFLLDMGEPLKIIDIAKKMIELRGLKVLNNTTGTGDIEIKIIGLKPGEKLYEELLIDGDAKISSNPNIFYGKDSHIDFTNLSTFIDEVQNIIKENDMLKVRRFLEEKTDLKS